ncbi:DNA-directed RNA polymerase III subunit RPC3 isoform X2 [Agrilus planipennis]|uniref:DNA-directed RNA polymerase III subunit RPC3 n=1 Tax=Agrilus planipennis TaxID=224129 RepID=A0A1W4XJI8_AGRPL|nr:DNA-directed RNA polymerase III subunit RPC3 isoform X2 [Agrilus planipennis]
MSSQYGKVISFILLERFGEIVEKVGSCLFHYGSSPLLYIKKYTNLPLSQVKEALCILIKYNLVTFVPNKNENIANYSLKCENIFLMLRYPKYIILIKKKFEDEGEVILEEVLLSGFSSASEIIFKSFNRLKEMENKTISEVQLRDVFMALVTAQYLMRIYIPEGNKAVPQLEISEKDKFIFPSIEAIEVKNLIEKNIPLKQESYWTINFDRFHQDLRDKLIISAITKKIDENAGELMKTFLEQMYIRTTAWADTSNPIPIQEVKNVIKKKNSLHVLSAFLDQYINVMEQDYCKMIRKFGEAGGGSYQIYLKDIIIHLVWETIEQIVLEKFDSKAARIFRLIRLKSYIEPEQIQQLAMIPAKEAKRLCYQLLEENFIKVQELRKSSSNSGPTKSFIFFNIQIAQVVRMVLELCYKSLYNVMTRRLSEKNVNKRIIDKKQRVDTIMLGMKVQGATEEQLADIEEMITPPEKELLGKIGKTMKKLNLVELELDDTVFLLELFLRYD